MEINLDKWECLYILDQIDDEEKYCIENELYLNQQKFQNLRDKLNNCIQRIEVENDK